MKTEQQRITIAEACGWNFHPPCYNEGPFSTEFKAEALACWVRPGNMQHQTEYPPDYLNDLNAIHEAEKLFIGDASNAMTYAMHLLRARGQDINNENDDLNCGHAWIAANATASERAKAFLKTLDLWQE